MSICKAVIKTLGIHVASSYVLKLSIRQKKLNAKKQNGIKFKQSFSIKF